MAGGIAGQGQRVVQRRAPHVAAVDQASGEHAAGRQRLQHRVQLRHATHQVHVDAVHRQRHRQFQVVAQFAEVAGQQQFRPRRLRQEGVGTLIGGARGVVQVQHQRRFVELHPAGAGRMQALQQFGVHRQQAVQQRPAVAAVHGLGQRQEGHRPDQHRPGLDALRLGFQELHHRLVAAQAEVLAPRQLRHQVVVVGVEPLGHFQRVQVQAVFLRAAGHREVAGQRVGIGQRAVALRDRIEQERGVEHRVVQAEVVAGRHVHPGLALQLPVAQAQLACGVLQLRAVDVAAPVAFQRLLELAPRTDAREAQVGHDRHVAFPHCVQGH
ncbi:hypothetical protein NB706_003695 [Xanthomonas sacchari]|nr:hypothetical protein [Xanthomonas sacchari]